jgi:ABC-type branched-subunit amino acid transport system ATPase component
MSDGARAAVLDVVEAAVRFGGVRAVDGVTLSLGQGGLHGLVGPNGSGKSTLLSLISRTIRMNSGSLSLRGERYESVNPSRVARLGIARTFQTVRLLPGLTVLENVMFGADERYFGNSIGASWLMPWRTRAHERAAREAARAAIAQLSLEGFEQRLPAELSYGTQRRVEIARALVSEPVLLLLDEPTAGMNRSEREEIGETLDYLRSHGITQLLVEHDVGFVTKMCDQLFVMNMGKLVAEGAPSDVVELPVVREAYLGKGARRATA